MNSIQSTIFSIFVPIILSGAVTIIVNRQLIKRQFKAENNNKKIFALSKIDSIINFLQKIRFFNKYGIDEYFSIFESIEDLSAFFKRIKSLNESNYYFNQEIRDEINVISTIIENIIADYNYKAEDGNYSLIQVGVLNHTKINTVLISVNKSLKKEYETIK